MSDEYDDFDDDFDEIDDDMGMGFEDADNAAPSKDRSAIVETFSGAAPHFLDDFKDTSVIKQVGEVADSAFQAAAGKKVAANYNKLKSTMNKEFSTSSRQIKEAAKPFVSKLKDSLPEDGVVSELVGKLDNFLGSKKASSEETDEARAQRESNELLISIFGEQSKKDVLDQTIRSLSDKGRDDLLRQMTAIGQTTLEFHNSNTIGYYKKSIELKYKHLFETKRMFKLQVKSFETFKRQFETIVKNTGLPEFVKIRGLEAAKANIRDRAFGTAYESLSNNNSWIDNARNNITNRFRSTTQGITDGLHMANEGLDMATELGDQLSDADQRNMLIGSMGAEGTRTISGRLLGGLFSKTKRGKKFKEWISMVNGDPGKYFGDMAENSTGLKSKAAGFASNIVSLDDNYQPYKDLARESLDAASYLDNRTKKSINTVIPALLSRIFGSVEGIRTGNDPDGLTYDFTRDTLISNSNVKASIIRDFGVKTSKAHTAGIESFVKLLVDASDSKLTKEEMKALGSRLMTFGIKDKNISLNRLEEIGFFNGLDVRTELIYRSLFENMGKDSDGKVDHAVRDVINKALGKAVNIRSNPDKIVQEAIDNGHTDKLLELGIIKWDDVKQTFIIDLAKFDMYTIQGINDNLFKDKEELLTVDDVRSKQVKDFVIKSKGKVTGKLNKLIDKYVDPLVDKIVQMEADYDDPETKHELKRIKTILDAGTEAAMTGNDVNVTKKKLQKLHKDINNMLKGQINAVKKKKKTKWGAVKGFGTGLADKLKRSGLGTDVVKDAKEIADRAKRTASATNKSIAEEFDINVSKLLNSGKVYILKHIEDLIVKRYGLDIEKDAKTIKAMRAIVYSHLSALDTEDFKSMTPKGIQDIYQNIIDDIEEEGLHLKGINTKRINKDMKNILKEARKKAGISTEEFLKDKEDDTENVKLAKKKLREAKEFSLDEKEGDSDTVKYLKGQLRKLKPSKGKGSKDGEESGWINKLSTSITGLTNSLSLPKFDKFDKDKDGDRDGGYLDRLEFFKRTKGKSKTEDKKSKGGKSDKDSGLFGILSKIFGATLFAPIKFMAATLAGIPKAFGGLLSGIGSMGGLLGTIGSTLGWGLSGIMALLRGGSMLWKGAGRADKWLGPKLRTILNPKNIFSKKGLLVAGAGLLTAHNWDKITDGVSSLWEDATKVPPKVDLTTPDIPDPDFNDTSIDGNTTSVTQASATALAAGLAAREIHKRINKGDKTAKAAKSLGKRALKIIPGVSTPLYAYEASTRYDEGNYLGAAASALAIPVSYIPFVGGVAGLGLSIATETEDEIPTAGNDSKLIPSNNRGMVKLLLDRIAKGEIGTSESKGYNTTLGFGKYIPKGTKPIYTMTIDEVYELQATMIRNGASSSAVGRYQFIGVTLRELVKAAGIDTANTIFSPSLQDALILRRLNGKRGFTKWRKGLIDDDAFIFNLSKEFASIACPLNTMYKGKKVVRGKSFYGQAVHTTLDDMYKVLNAMRKAGGGVPIEREETSLNKKTPEKKSKFVKGILSAIEGLFEFLGIETKGDKYTPNTELDDGTPVYDNGNAGYGNTLSKVKGNSIEGTYDPGKQLGGLPYKHVKYPSIAGPTIVPKYIVLHNTAGSSLYLGRMKAKGVGTALWIDTNGDTILVNNLTNRTWHVGPIKNLKGGAKQLVRSSNSIGIEMVCAYNKKTKQWNRYTTKQKETLRKVVAFLMKQFDIPLRNVVAHIQIAYKTEGEGMEALAVVNGAAIPEVPIGGGDMPIINNDVVATIPSIDIPVKTLELDDGTPVYDNVDNLTKEEMIKKATIKGQNGEALKPLDMDNFLRDLDISLGKSIKPSLDGMIKELQINNKYQSSIADNAGKGTKHELIIKNEKGEEMKKATVAPNKLEFDRATL